MGCQLEKDVYNRLDICELTNRARAGLLAYGTQLEIRRTLSDVLIDKGLRRSQAEVGKIKITRCSSKININITPFIK